LIKKSCDCGCTIFHVNKRDKMLSCIQCNKRFIHDKDNWIELKPKRKISFIPTTKEIKETISNHVETISEWKKRFNIKRIKKKVVDERTINEIQIIHDYENNIKIQEKQIRVLWENELNYLKNNGTISFKRNMHKGKLRGKNIAINFHRDLNTLGVENRLYFRSDKAFIELKKNREEKGVRNNE